MADPDRTYPDLPGGNPPGRRPGGGGGNTNPGNTNTNPGNTNTNPGSSGYDPAAAERRAIARENEAKRKAGEKYLKQAKNLDIQARALRDALRNEFKRSRNQNLADISLVLNQQIKILKRNASKRADQFLTVTSDAEKAAADTAEQGFSNLTRERSDSMSALLTMGAGETDVLRAMLMSATNWHANASENNRSYFDTLASVNQGITDLNIDTQTALANAFSGAESERERVWQEFYNRRSEAFTQLGNIRGQQADYYAAAKEMGVSPGSGKVRDTEKAMKDAFGKAANELGKSYKNKGLPKWVRKYEGQELMERRQTNTELGAAMTFEPVQRAEGATLRKWEGSA